MKKTVILMVVIFGMTCFSLVSAKDNHYQLLNSSYQMLDRDDPPPAEPPDERHDKDHHKHPPKPQPPQDNPDKDHPQQPDPANPEPDPNH